MQETQNERMSQQVINKMTPNGKVRLYLPQREFIDYLTGIQPIDGAVVVKFDYLDADRVFAVQLMTIIRYGREEIEVMDCSMSKELCLASIVLNDTKPPEKLTQMQANLKQMYGDTCFPFHVEWPKDTAASLFIEQPPGATGEPCGIRHYLEVFCLYRGDKPHKRSTVRLDVNLIQLPGKENYDSAGMLPPAVAINHPVFLSPGRIQLEACLEKTIICDEEPLVINLTISNNSKQTIKKMKAKLMQFYSVTVIKGQKKIEITRSVTTDGFPIAPGGTLNQTVTLFPRVPIGPAQEGVAVRALTSKSSVRTFLASSTLFVGSESAQDKFGFIVSYRVVIKLSLVSPVVPEVVAKVPIYIMARKPDSLDSNVLSNVSNYGSQEDFMEIRQRKLNGTPKAQKKLSLLSQSPLRSRKCNIPKLSQSQSINNLV